jgi:hypothetical protein
VKDEFALAFKLVSEPLEIIMPGEAELPSIRLSVLPVPKLIEALPNNEKLLGVAEYVNVRLLAVKFAPPIVVDVLAAAERLLRIPFEMTIPGVVALPTTSVRLRPLPKFNDAFP